MAKTEYPFEGFQRGRLVFSDGSVHYAQPDYFVMRPESYQLIVELQAKIRKMRLWLSGSIVAVLWLGAFVSWWR